MKAEASLERRRKLLVFTSEVEKGSSSYGFSPIYLHISEMIFTLIKKKKKNPCFLLFRLLYLNGCFKGT